MIHKITCENCGKVNELLNDYLYYFRQLQKQYPFTTLTCDCGKPIKFGKLGKTKDVENV